MIKKWIIKKAKLIRQKSHKIIVIRLCKKSCSSKNETYSHSCFSTILKFKKRGGDYIVDELNGNVILCRSFDGDLWINKTKIPLEDIYQYDILTTYLFKPNYFYTPKEKKGLFNIYLLYLTRYPYIFNILYKIICEPFHILHLNKEASANEKNNLLKFLVKEQINNGKQEIQANYILNNFFHAYNNQSQKDYKLKMEFYLNSLVESKDIRINGTSIKIHGKAIDTINEFDSSKSKQRIAFMFQLLMTLATIIIAYFAYTNKN